MKYGNYMKAIQHVEVFPVMALILFVSVFIGVVIYIYSLNNAEINDRANIPLNDSSN